MIPQIFELHLAQTESLLIKTGKLKFSDSRKTIHLSQLNELFKKIKESDYSSFDVVDLNTTKECIEYFLLMDLEFLLHSSDKSIVPIELIFCVECVLKEWINKPESYILVTSLTNKFNDYSFQFKPDDKLSVLELFIKNKFKIEFQYKLLLINMPSPLAEDFLSNVILFHEIGHFIDKKEKITERLFDLEPQLKALENSINIKDRYFFVQYKNYFQEFFADLFASQYIKDSCALHLKYFAFGDGNSYTHPATADRVEIVEKFLNKVQDDRIDIIQKYTTNITGKSLIVRFIEITGNYSNKKIIPISKEGELYSLFIKGWECWIDSKVLFPRRLKSGLLNGYKKLNQLIRDSIKSYISNLQSDKNKI